MSGRILIIDAVATNRMTLRVKMLAAQFLVETCATPAEARSLLAAQRPDLILMNLSDPGQDHRDFCKALKTDPDSRSIALLAVGVTKDPQARLAALTIGADDVMTRPLHDVLLLARIRSLLRARAATQELALRDSTNRALGFADQPLRFTGLGQMTLISASQPRPCDLAARLRRGLGQDVQELDVAAVLCATRQSPAPDLLIIPADNPDTDPAALFGLVSDLRARSETRQSAILVVVPDTAADTAALFLDLGADDVVTTKALPAELALRAQSLVQRKQEQDALRRNLQAGLQAAVTDPLTGLFNRRYVDHHLTRMRDLSLAAGRELAVMMIDIDHFKAINDAFGHAAGDRVLVALAARLRDNLRAVDLVARIGGEEFLIAMPRTSAAQAQGAANRLRRLVAQTPFDLGEARAPANVTISVGIALSGEPGTPPQAAETMCHLADAALYQAKATGRDRVALHLSAV